MDSNVYPLKCTNSLYLLLNVTLIPLHNGTISLIFLWGNHFEKLIGCKFCNNEKQQILTWRNTSPRLAKSYIDNNLNPAKEFLIDATKDSFTQPLSTKETLDRLEISKDGFYRVLLILNTWYEL